MKYIFFVLLATIAIDGTVNAQETQQKVDSVLVTQEKLEQQEKELAEAKAKQKHIDKAEKAQKKAEKAQKKAEKELKKREKLAKSIASRKKDINKSETKIRKLQSKLAKGKSKGKISPVDEMEINQKINKLELSIAKDRERLNKLQQKQ